MTPFAGINRITSPYGYREYWYNGRLIKEHHKGQDIVPTQQAGRALPESAWNVRELTGGTVTAVSKTDIATGQVVEEMHLVAVLEQLTYVERQLAALGL